MSYKRNGFFMMVGLPGVGKSTFINKQKTDNTVVISSDDIIEEYAAQNGITYSEAFPVAIKLTKSEMERRLINAISDGKEIFWDQTNLTKKSRADKLAKIPKNYTKIAVVFETPDETEHARRLAARPGKEIPASVLEDMKKSFKTPSVDEGFDGIMKIPVDGDFPF